MATTDNAIQYDVKVVKHLLQYLEYSSEKEKMLLELVEEGVIQRDRVVELAMSKVGGYEITSIDGQDFSDGSDAKSVTSNARNNNPKLGVWTNSFEVPKVATKIGALRIIAYNKILEKFHYFYIPRNAFKHLKGSLSINIETFTSRIGEPLFTGIPDLNKKFWEYECSSFIEMAMRKENESTIN